MSAPALTRIEAECDHALMLAKLRARYLADADRHPIVRRSYRYLAGRLARQIVNASIRVEIWAQRELDARA